MIPEDSVLRCLVPVKFQGETRPQIFNAVRDGDDFLIVLEWGCRDGASGVSPRQCFVIPASEMRAEVEPSSDYELVSQTGIDFDSAAISDVETVTQKAFRMPPGM